MIYRGQRLRSVRLSWITKRPGRAWVGSVPNKHNPSKKLGLGACISSRITMVIHVMNDHQINDNCFNEPFAVSPCRSLYWDMHGLIFETSIWLLAGSTRFVSHHHNANRNIKFSTHEVAFKQLCCKCKQKRVTNRQRFLRKKLPRRRPVGRWRKEDKKLPSTPNERSALYQHKSANIWHKS